MKGWWLVVVMCVVSQWGYAAESRNYAENPQARDFIDYMIKEHDLDPVDMQLIFAEDRRLQRRQR